MGGPTLPPMPRPPAPVDPTDAMTKELAYAETQRRLRASGGRAASFTNGTGSTPLIPRVTNKLGT